MRWTVLAPVILFVITMFTSLRLPAVAAAAAGLVAGAAAAASLGLYDASPFELLVIFGVMAFAEAVAASVFARGPLGGALVLALLAHGALLYLILHDPWPMGRDEVLLWLLPPALLGGSAAAAGARLGRSA